MRLTAYLASRQGLQKWWPQGVESGSARTPLHSVQVNSRSARSCSEACAGGGDLTLHAEDGQCGCGNIWCRAFPKGSVERKAQRCHWRRYFILKAVLHRGPVRRSGSVIF